MYNARLLITLFAVSQISAYVYEYYPTVDKYYKFFDESTNWDQAKLRCEMENTTLAVPVTVRELEVLATIFRSHSKSSDSWPDKIFWLGYHDYFEEGRFISVFDNQSMPTDFVWFPGEPNENATRENQDCLVVGKDLELFDGYCDHNHKYCCQKHLKSGAIITPYDKRVETN